MQTKNQDFRWGFHVRYLKALGIKRQPRQMLLKAIEAGTIKHLGRGQYRLTGKRKRAVKEGA
jgi:hypothetical protein